MTTLSPSYRAAPLIRGFTLIETLVALAIGMVILVGVSNALQRYGDSIANQAAAGHANTVKKATQSYIADNYAALVAAAGPTTPATVAPATLAGYLPAGFNPVNGYGQTFIVKIIEPSAGRLESIILTSGGDPINGQNMRRIAQLIGVDGGYVATTGASAVAEGAFGGWSRNLSPFGGSVGAGKLAVALFVSDVASQDDYLHRTATTGRPDLNRMNTAIDMAGNDLNNAGTVSAAKIDLPGGNSLQIGSSYYYGDSANSAVRQNGGLYIQTPGGASAPINQVGNISSQGSVGVVGDVTAGKTVSGNNVWANESYANGWFRTQGGGGWYSSAFGGGWHMTDPTWIRAYNSKNIYTPGQFLGGTVRATSTVTADQVVSAGQSVSAGLDVAAGRNVAASANVSANGNVNAGNNVDAGGRVTAGEYLLPQGEALCNAACSTNGLIGRTTAGALLSCDTGTWKGYACDAGDGDDMNGGCMVCIPPWYPNGNGCSRLGWPDRVCQ